MPRPLAEQVDPQQAALILVDVQNDFCHPDGASGRGEESGLTKCAHPILLSRQVVEPGLSQLEPQVVVTARLDKSSHSCREGA